MRGTIRQIIAGLKPFDAQEAEDRGRALDWIASGAPLCRAHPPNEPDPHLVSYFAVIDGNHILLGDHIKSGLWLPSGGHVERGEHPKETARREALEELSLTADFIDDAPLFITATVTKGAGPHTDISLWFALYGRRNEDIEFDRGEYHRVAWFPFADLPLTRTDPQLARFCAKFTAMMVPAP